MTQKRKQLSPRKNVPKKTKEKICDMLPGMCKGGNSTQLKEECQTEVVKKANRKTNLWLQEWKGSRANIFICKCRKHGTHHGFSHSSF